MTSTDSNEKKFSDVYDIEQGQEHQTQIIVSDIYHDNHDIFKNALFKNCMKKIFGQKDFDQGTDYFPDTKPSDTNTNFLTPFYKELDVNNPNNNRLLLKKKSNPSEEPSFVTSDHELKFGKVDMNDMDNYYKSLAFFIDDPTAYEYYLDNGGTRHINERHEKSNIDPNWTPIFNIVAGLIKDPASLSGTVIVDKNFIERTQQTIDSNKNSGYKDNNYKLTYYYDNLKNILYFNVEYNLEKIIFTKKYYIDLNDRTKKGALKIFRYDDITEPISFTLSNVENQKWFNENGSQTDYNYIEEGIERILLKHWGDRDIIRTLENAIKSADIPKVTGSNSMILTEDRFVSLFSRYSNVNSFYFHSTVSSKKRSGTPTPDSASPSASDSNSGSGSDSELNDNVSLKVKDTDYASFYTKQIKDEEQMKEYYKFKCENNINEFKKNIEQLEIELISKLDAVIQNMKKQKSFITNSHPKKLQLSITIKNNPIITKEFTLTFTGMLFQLLDNKKEFIKRLSNSDNSKSKQFNKFLLNFINDYDQKFKYTENILGKFKQHSKFDEVMTIFFDDINTNVLNEIKSIIQNLEIICINLSTYINSFHDYSNLELIDKFITILRNMFQNQTYILNDIFNNILEKTEKFQNINIDYFNDKFIDYIISDSTTNYDEQFIETFITSIKNNNKNIFLENFEKNLYNYNTSNYILDYHISLQNKKTSIHYSEILESTLSYSEILENFLDCFKDNIDYEACFQALTNPIRLELIEHKSNNDIDNMIDFLKNKTNYVNVRIKMKVGTGEEAAVAEDDEKDMVLNGGAMHEGMRQHSGSQQQMYYLECGNPDNEKYNLSCNPNNTLYEESDADTEILLDVIYSIHNIAVFKYYNIFTLLFIKPHNQTTSSNPTIQLVIDYLIENNSDKLHKNKKEALFKTYFSNIGLERASEMATEVARRAEAMAMADSMLAATERDAVADREATRNDNKRRRALKNGVLLSRTEKENTSPPKRYLSPYAHARTPPPKRYLSPYAQARTPVTKKERAERTYTTSIKRYLSPSAKAPPPARSRPNTWQPPLGPIGGKKTKKLKIYKTKAHNIKVSNKTKNKKNKKKIILNKTLKPNIRNNSNKKNNLKKRLKKANQNQNKKNKKIKRIKNYNKSLKKTKKNKKYIYNISIKRK